MKCIKKIVFMSLALCLFVTGGFAINARAEEKAKKTKGHSVASKKKMTPEEKAAKEQADAAKKAAKAQEAAAKKAAKEQADAAKKVTQ